MARLLDATLAAGLDPNAPELERRPRARCWHDRAGRRRWPHRVLDEYRWGLIPRGPTTPPSGTGCSTPVPRPWRTSRRSARPTARAASPSRRRLLRVAQDPGGSRQPTSSGAPTAPRSCSPGSTSSGATRPSRRAHPGSVRAPSSPRPPARTWPPSTTHAAILESDAFDAWLDPDAERPVLDGLLLPAAGARWHAWRWIGAWATSPTTARLIDEQQRTARSRHPLLSRRLSGDGTSRQLDEPGTQSRPCGGMQRPQLGADSRTLTTRTETPSAARLRSGDNLMTLTRVVAIVGTTTTALEATHIMDSIRIGVLGTGNIADLNVAGYLEDPRARSSLCATSCRRPPRPPHSAGACRGSTTTSTSSSQTPTSTPSRCSPRRTAPRARPRRLEAASTSRCKSRGQHHRRGHRDGQGRRERRPHPSHQ